MKKKTYKKLSKRDVKALRECVDKYKRLSRAAPITIKFVDLSSRSCALCAIYYGFGACTGCPVSVNTGKPGCEGTPYFDCHGLGISNYRWQTEVFHKMAAAEARFLNRLLKKAPNGPFPCK